MKILVTGGLGLIGHNVVSKMQQLGVELNIIDNRTNYGIVPQDELDYLMQERIKKINNHAVYNASIEHADPIEYIVKTTTPDCIVHLASFPRQKVVNANPRLGADVMMRGLINLLESAKTHQIKRFVYISSSMVYGDFKDDVTEDASCNPQGQYGIMKLAGEWLVKDYARRTGMEYVIIRPSAVYGPLDVEDRVVAKFMLTAMRGGLLRVNGASEILDFTYVDDAADGIVSACLAPDAKNQTFNITKSHSVSLMQAAEMIVKMVGHVRIEDRGRDLDFPSRGALNIDRARTILGYNPKVDVEEGFQRYRDWLSNSPYWSSKL
jgi:nucleoside-diphosphate-sugar epimerase